MAQKKQKKARSKPLSGASVRRSTRSGSTTNLLDDFRQLLYPPEFRIERPIFQVPDGGLATGSSTNSPTSIESQLFESDIGLDQAIAEVATCLWYLKTKYFRRPWTDHQCEDDDARVRHALGRINKGLDALHHGGVEVEDPTDKRYPPGGEAMMRPLQFVPTEGLTYERVTEAVVPIVFYRNRIVQRAEVFVAVPPPKTSAGEESASKTDNGGKFDRSVQIESLNLQLPLQGGKCQPNLPVNKPDCAEEAPVNDVENQTSRI